MNYITQIKAFQEVAQDKQLSTGQIALYHALLYINNRCAWTEWFTVANLSLELNSGLSRNGIAKNRNILKQLRLIDFKSNGTKATQYNISDLEKTGFTSVQASVQIGVQDSVQSSVQVGVQSSGTLNKLNETKLNNIPSISPKGETKSKVPLYEQSFLSCKEILDNSDLLAEEKIKLGQWLQHKRERKDKYTNTGFNTLISEYKNNVRKFGREAMFQTIEQSMASGYVGIVWDRLKKTNEEKPTKKERILR